MRLAVNGVHLNVEEAGHPHAPTVLLLHGFTGSAASWSDLVSALSTTHRVLAVDLIGHGQSDAPAAPERYRMEQAVDDLLALLDSLALEQIGLLGYSLGGRVALQLAVAVPHRIARLLLESASPGIEDPAERQARQASDDALADRLERDGLPAFVDYWASIPLFASQASLPAAVRERMRQQRLGSSPAGLANSLRGMGAGRPRSLWDDLPNLGIPTQIVVGALDAKYCEQGRRMAGLLPKARLAIVPGAGHTVHLEQPDRFRDIALEFFSASTPTLAATSFTTGGAT
jgi:2-succinyl-6-hydroxy-2,4-cyclohexadiene-1-carboxylate synthase